MLSLFKFVHKQNEAKAINRTQSQDKSTHSDKKWAHVTTL